MRTDRKQRDPMAVRCPDCGEVMDWWGCKSVNIRKWTCPACKKDWREWEIEKEEAG